MKYKTGDKVRKIKGYKFEGIIIGGGYKLDRERILYMVEIPTHAPETAFGLYVEQNCGGMVHIFAEDDIELIK